MAIRLPTSEPCRVVHFYTETARESIQQMVKTELMDRNDYDIYWPDHYVNTEQTPEGMFTCYGAIPLHDIEDAKELSNYIVSMVESTGAEVQTDIRAVEYDDGSASVTDQTPIPT